MKKVIVFVICFLMLLGLCACSAATEFVDSTVVKSTGNYYSLLQSFQQDLFVFEPNAEGYEFEIHAQDGSFYTVIDNKAAHVSALQINGSGGAIWTSVVPEESDTAFYDGQETYVDVLIKRDEQYVGYAVVLIASSDPTAYKAQVLACKEATPEQAQKAGLTREMLEEYIQNVKDGRSK